MYMRFGGSDGHASRYHMNAYEGHPSWAPDKKVWQVEILPQTVDAQESEDSTPSEIREDDKAAVRRVLSENPAGLTANKINETAFKGALKHVRELDKLIAAMADELVEVHQGIQSNPKIKKFYDGWKLKNMDG